MSSDPRAQRMKTARLERNMTQIQLADRLGVRQSMVSMIESGEVTEDARDATDQYGGALAKRIDAWIESGSGPTKKTVRGPYKKTKPKARTTLPKR